MKLHTPSALLGAILVALLALVTAFASPQMTIQPIPCGLTQAQKDVLDLLSVVTIEDCTGGPGYKTLRVTGANLQVVNGLGNTSTTNGLGNIIAGYHEGEQPAPCNRSGSHNFVGGTLNDYSSYGGVVFGQEGEMMAPFGVVLGGRFNQAEGDYSVVVGGGEAFAAFRNQAIGDYSVVVGGRENDAVGISSVVNGGQTNQTTGQLSVVLGGQLNLASGSQSTVSGGRNNDAVGQVSSVSGGNNRDVFGLDDWSAGSLFEDN